MSPSSNTSSVAAQNGSSYSRSYTDLLFQESEAGSTHPSNSTSQVRYPVDVSYDHSAAPTLLDTRGITNDQTYQNDYAVDYTDGKSYTNGDYSQSAPTYDTDVSADNQRQSLWDDQGSQQHREYYLPPPSYPQDSTCYGPELVLDSIEDEQDSAHEPNQLEDGSARTRFQQPLTAGRNHPGPQQNNIARTPTARRWSREYSPEERMRVGLPRWETEQDRMRYYERQPRRSRRRRS